MAQDLKVFKRSLGQDIELQVSSSGEFECISVLFICITLLTLEGTAEVQIIY